MRGTADAFMGNGCAVAVPRTNRVRLNRKAKGPTRSGNSTNVSFQLVGGQEFVDQLREFKWDLETGSAEIATLVATSCKSFAPIETGELHGSIRPYRNGPNVGGAVCDAYYGWWQEYGTDHGIEPVHFMRDGFNAVVEQIPGIFANVAQKNLDDQVKPTK